MAKLATMKVWAVDLGLAVHIKAPNGRYIVIDLGSKDGVSPLQSLEGKDVGYLVITHPHHDHFSDIRNIDCVNPDVLWRVTAFSREELMEGVRASEKDDFKKYCDFSDRFNKDVSSQKKPSSGIPFDGLTATVFSTNSCNKNNINNFSGIVVLQLGNAKVVVCGDNQKESFENLIKEENFKKAVAKAYVLVAPHHGRDSGFYDEFVNMVEPYITIISDTAKSDTSVTEKYEAKTKGCNVINRSSEKAEERKCLTTRNDGNIKVIFGESDDPNYTGTLSVYSHC